eukprot:7378691-Prymnesium_polylepis.1
MALLMARLPPLAPRSPHFARWLAKPGLDKVKELQKPKSKTVRRRPRFDPSDNPFLANAGGMGAAENQIKSFMAEGGFEQLDGEGKPLPHRNVPPFLSRDEQVLNDVAQHMTKERDSLSTDDKAVFRRSAINDAINEKRKARAGEFRAGEHRGN